MEVTQYIGARYVPVLANPVEWSSANAYEPLTIVMYQGDSYTSRQAVPVGVAITNEGFWACTGNFNAQIEAYRQEVARIAGQLSSIETTAGTAASDAQSALAKIGTGFDSTDTVRAAVDAINMIIGTLPDGTVDIGSALANIAADVSANAGDIDALETTLTGFDSTHQVKDYIDNAVSPLETPKHAVFIGDSFTSAYYLTQAGDSETDRWCYPVAEFVGATPHIYAERGAGYRRAGTAADGGHTFTDMLQVASLDSSFDNDDVGYLFVYGGLNDLDHEQANSVFGTEYPDFCTRARSTFPNAKIFICGINAWPESLSINEYVSGSNHYTRTQMFYEQVMKSDNAFMQAHCSFISMCGALGFKSSYYYSANRHPNVLGNQALATWIICAMSGTPICQSCSGSFTKSDDSYTGGTIVAHFKPGAVECFVNLGATFDDTYVKDSLNIVADQALDLRGCPLVTESGNDVVVGYLGGRQTDTTPYGYIHIVNSGFGRFVRLF